MSELHSLVLTSPKGLETLLLDEAAGLGLQDGRSHVSTVHGRATLETAYRLCLWSRLANRVLLVLGCFRVDTPDALYEAVCSIDWSEHLLPSGSLAVEFSGHGSGIDNTHFGALKVKDAIV
ncbi:MAG: THUMP domain-containing protein, partial [Pseudomonas sp.]